MAELRRLQYFIAVARERNFTRAAERLHIAQPALSRQVRALEDELGVELLQRTTHQVQLTAAGEFLLERGPALLGAADELWRSVRTYGTGERGEVRVAYGASAAYETAPRLLAALSEHHPEIAITTEVRSATEIVNGLADGWIDVGVVRCPPPRDALESHTIRHEDQGVLMRADHALAASESAAVGDLRDETLLVHPRDANPGHYDALLALCRDHGFEPRIALRELSFDLGQSPVRLGEAVAIVGESSSTGLPAGLCWRPIVPAVRFDVGLVVRRHGRPSAVNRVMDGATAIAAGFGWV